MGVQRLLEWHRPRFEALASHKETDVIAFETIPCLTEVSALISLLQTKPQVKAWLAVSCNAVDTLNSGELLEDFVKLVE
jgi:homocysteine S-methyltransferase